MCKSSLPTSFLWSRFPITSGVCSKSEDVKLVMACQNKRWQVSAKLSRWFKARYRKRSGTAQYLANWLPRTVMCQDRPHQANSQRPTRPWQPHPHLVDRVRRFRLDKIRRDPNGTSRSVATEIRASKVTTRLSRTTMVVMIPVKARVVRNAARRQVPLLRYDRAPFLSIPHELPDTLEPVSNMIPGYRTRIPPPPTQGQYDSRATAQAWSAHRTSQPAAGSAQGVFFDHENFELDDRVAETLLIAGCSYHDHVPAPLRRRV
jgi:hypothetical protein